MARNATQRVGQWGGACAVAWGALAPAVASGAPQAPPLVVLQEVRQIVHRDFYAPQALGSFEQLERRLASTPPRGSGRGPGSASPPGSRGAEAAPAASSAVRADSDRAIDELLRSLGCSHSARFVPEQVEYYDLLDIFAASLGEPLQRLFPGGRVTYAGIGVVARPIDGRSFVAYVYDGGPADQAGLLVGDELLTVDGAPFSPVQAFAGKGGKRVEVRVRRQSNGPVRALSVPVVEMQPTETLRKAIASSVEVLERGGRRFGYLRLWSFADPQILSIVRDALASEPLASTEGLVLDLRSRWGGAPPDAAELFVGGTPNMALVGPDEKTLHVNVRWRRPLVGIIDAGTRSGMEVLAYSLQKAGVPLVGANTAGAVLGGRPYLLGDDSLLLLAVMDVILDGKRLEGVGVPPSIDVPFDIRYAAGRDPQLERALGELARRAPRPGSPR